MNAPVRGIFTAARSLTAVAATAMAATIMLTPSAANAAPVEYVRICSLYGAGFFYLPGTDTCIDFATNDARVQTEGGTWRWRVPNNPRTWVRSPEDACQGGELVEFGDISSFNLTENLQTRFETDTRYRLRLRPGQYIASVLYRGGFTGVGKGNFCMYYTYDVPKYGIAYVPLGCIDTAPQASVPATLMFSPDAPIPPAGGDVPYVVGANGEAWPVASGDEIQGTLSVWLCLQDVPNPGPVR